MINESRRMLRPYSITAAFIVLSVGIITLMIQWN